MTSLKDTWAVLQPQFQVGPKRRRKSARYSQLYSAVNGLFFGGGAGNREWQEAYRGRKICSVISADGASNVLGKIHSYCTISGCWICDVCCNSRKARHTARAPWASTKIERWQKAASMQNTWLEFYENVMFVNVLAMASAVLDGSEAMKWNEVIIADVLADIGSDRAPLSTRSK